VRDDDAQEHTGHGIEQPDHADDRAGQPRQPGEPRGVGDRRRHEDDVRETEQRRSIEAGGAPSTTIATGATTRSRR
jgi:hypothetical protein